MAGFDLELECSAEKKNKKIVRKQKRKPKRGTKNVQEGENSREWSFLSPRENEPRIQTQKIQIWIFTSREKIFWADSEVARVLQHRILIA